MLQNLVLKLLLSGTEVTRELILSCLFVIIR